MFNRKIVFDANSIDVSSKIGCRMSVLRMYAAEKGIENVNLAKAKELCNFLLDGTEIPGVQQPPTTGIQKIENFLDGIFGLGKKYKSEIGGIADFVSGFRGTPPTDNAIQIEQLPMPDDDIPEEQNSIDNNG